MSQRLHVATKKGLFRVERTGNSTAFWTITKVDFLGENVGLMLHDPRDNSLYATLDHGHFGAKLHRSVDDGQTWTEIGVPVYPPRSEAEKEVDGMGREIPWKLNKIWALEPGHTSEPGLLWAGTIPGGLFRSADYGATWEFNQPLWDHPLRKGWFGGGADWPGIHSICIDPRNPKRLTLGVSCGGIWVTEDAGQSWKCDSTGMWAAYMPPEQKFVPNIQDPHRLVQCPANPDHLWAQHHNGIFRSTDGAVSWQDVSNVQPSSFGFGVAVDPHDPQTAWFVPGVKDEQRIPPDGQVFVARTRDGGKTYERLTNGLPQSHAYDIAYRHALTISPDGKVLAFGTTTGSVWISEDRGDSWQTVSNHLPPVYCTRFAAS